MPIAARYADVWHSYGPPEYMAQKSQRLTAMAEEAGRDPAEILRASSLSLDDVDDAVRLIDEWEKAGFDYLVCGWPGAGRDAGRSVRQAASLTRVDAAGLQRRIGDVGDDPVAVAGRAPGDVDRERGCR